MNEQLLKQLVRQMKIMNIWISSFGTLMILAIITVAVLLFQVVGFIGETNKKIDNVKQDVTSSVDVKQKACSAKNSFGDFLRNQEGVCE